MIDNMTDNMKFKYIEPQALVIKDGPKGKILGVVYRDGGPGYQAELLTGEKKWFELDHEAANWVYEKGLKI